MRREPLEIRFWRYVEKTSTCWLWHGLVVGGYGAIREGGKDGGKQLVAHHVPYILAGIDIPKGMQVNHKIECNNKLCVLHTYIGTHKDNMKDLQMKNWQVILPKRNS